MFYFQNGKFFYNRNEVQLAEWIEDRDAYTFLEIEIKSYEDVLAVLAQMNVVEGAEWDCCFNREHPRALYAVPVELDGLEFEVHFYAATEQIAEKIIEETF